MPWPKDNASPPAYRTSPALKRRPRRRGSARSPEVTTANCLRRLDLHTDDVAVRVLWDHIGLNLVPVTVVEELHRLLRPTELTGNLANDEVLKQQPSGLNRVLRPVRREPGQPAAQPG